MDNIDRTFRLAIGLIDPDNLKSDETILFEYSLDIFPRGIYKAFIKGNYWGIWCKYDSVIAKRILFEQSEFPLSSIPWFIDTIERGFWLDHKDGGLPDSTLSNDIVINNEMVGVDVVMSCGVDGEFGYHLWNLNRHSYINKRAFQFIQMPKRHLKDFLLNDLKKAAAKLGLKLLH